MMQQRPQLEHVSTRLDPETLRAIEQLATADRRPVAQVVRIAVEDWLEARRAQQSHGVRA